MISEEVKERMECISRVNADGTLELERILPKIKALEEENEELKEANKLKGYKKEHLSKSIVKLKAENKVMKNYIGSYKKQNAELVDIIKEIIAGIDYNEKIDIQFYIEKLEKILNKSWKEINENI